MHALWLLPSPNYGSCTAHLQVLQLLLINLCPILLVKENITAIKPSVRPRLVCRLCRKSGARAAAEDMSDVHSKLAPDTSPAAALSDACYAWPNFSSAKTACWTSALQTSLCMSARTVAIRCIRAAVLEMMSHPDKIVIAMTPWLPNLLLQASML